MARIDLTDDQKALLAKLNPNDIADIFREACDTAGVPFGTFIQAVVDGLPFISAEVTGTGSEQEIAHGQEKAPTKVFPSATVVPSDGYGSAIPYTFVEGDHDEDNILITVDSGVKYKVFAIF